VARLVEMFDGEVIGGDIRSQLDRSGDLVGHNAP
jgi:hypothetical protein